MFRTPAPLGADALGDCRERGESNKERFLNQKTTKKISWDTTELPNGMVQHGMDLTGMDMNGFEKKTHIRCLFTLDPSLIVVENMMMLLFPTYEHVCLSSSHAPQLGGMSCLLEGKELSIGKFPTTPPKTNMELENWWFGSMFLLFLLGANSGSMFVFGGVTAEGHTFQAPRRDQWPTMRTKIDALDM